jgi:hypothetical protein
VRNTVDRLLELKVPPRYERRSKGSLLDPFKADIAEMLDDDAEVPGFPDVVLVSTTPASCSPSSDVKADGSRSSSACGSNELERCPGVEACWRPSYRARIEVLLI